MFRCMDPCSLIKSLVRDARVEQQVSPPRIADIDAQHRVGLEQVDAVVHRVRKLDVCVSAPYSGKGGVLSQSSDKRD